MNEITKSSRVTTALQVIQRMNEGLSVKEACNEVGMARSTYYYIISREAEALAEFRDMVVSNDRERLWMILVNQTKLLQKIIEDGMAETTKPRERLAIYKTLSAQVDKLSQTLQMSSRDDAFAAEFLNGPALQSGTSRFASGSSEDGT